MSARISEEQARSLGIEVPKSLGGRSRRKTNQAERMNKTEARYASHLQAMQMSGLIKSFKYESIKLRLADKTWYKSDFLVVRKKLVMTNSHEHQIACVELHEVKGFWEDDARVKIKVAAEMYPFFKFVAVMANKSESMPWTYEEFL